MFMLLVMMVVVVVVVGTVSSWPCITQIYQRPSLGGKMRIEGRTLFDSFAEETQIHVFEAREQRLQKLLSSAGYGGAVLCQEGLWDASGGARLVLSGKLQTRPSEIVTENTKISCSLLFQNILNMLALDCLCFV